MKIQTEMLAELNAEQKEAVEHRDGPLLVLAGAGSGKTRVVTCRVAHLIEQGVPPDQILAVTFTNKAAKEMKDRIFRLVKERVWVSTFHSLGVRILRDAIHALGYKPDFTIYDQDDVLKLIKVCIADIDPAVKDAAKMAKALQGMISSAKNQLTSEDDVAEDLEMGTPRERLFGPVYRRYQAQLRACNAVDFDDLLMLPVRLFREHPDLLESYRSRWRYLMVDEYQDTNHAQYEMVKLLAGERCNLCVVGDPDQSIYSWRGADMGNILSFERDFPGAKVVRLEQNYRSMETILQASNALIEYNTDRYEKNLWSARGEGEPVYSVTTWDEREEANFVLDKMIQYNEEEGIPFSQMAVFYRTNFQSRVFEDTFLRRRIPYVIVGGLSFYQRAEIKDILAYLRMVQSGADYISFARSVNLPKRGIGPGSVDKLRLAAEAAEQPLFAFCEQLVEQPKEVDFRLGARQRAGLENYVNLIRELREVLERTGSLADLIEETIERSGYRDYLRLDQETESDRVENLQELVSKAAEWDQECEEPSLESFLEELSLKSTLDEMGESDDCANLMTVHNAKGLEFAVVFVVGLEEGLFPHVSSMDDYRQLEEERRLCYVGMTRAKEHLYLTRSTSRNVWGQYRMMSCSRFVKEIPNEFMEQI